MAVAIASKPGGRVRSVPSASRTACASGVVTGGSGGPRSELLSSGPANGRSSGRSRSGQRSERGRAVMPG